MGGVRKGRKIPDSLLEQLSDARAAVPQSRACWAKLHGMWTALQALGWHPDQITAQTDEYDRRHPRDPALRPCCRTDPFGGHRGTCLESVMYNGSEGYIEAEGFHS